MRCGFSNSTAQSEGWVQAVYQMFLDLQQSRIPFNVSTGKRQYTNMLVRSLAVKTDEASEFALDITIGLREILLTSVTSTTTSAANQANPQQTQSPVQRGAVAPLAAASGAPADPSVVAAAAVPAPPIPLEFNMGNP
jgi:hypothetical protein